MSRSRVLWFRFGDLGFEWLGNSDFIILRARNVRIELATEGRHTIVAGTSVEQDFIADREPQLAGFKPVCRRNPLLFAVVAQFNFFIEQQSTLMIEEQLQAADFKVRILGLKFQFE